MVRATRTFGHSWPWVRPLAESFQKRAERATRPRQGEIAQWILNDKGFQAAWQKHGARFAIADWITEPPQMQPASALRSLHLPSIETTRALADWFWLELEQLDWFADLKALTCRNQCPKTAHYHYRVLSKASGGVRLIEAPKKKLKRIQHQILEEILEAIPPHPAVHGFRRGRSIVTFTAPHVGQRMVLRIDLRNFFPSFSGARIQAAFRTMGYPEAVADILGGLCTNQVPRSLWTGRDLEATSAQLQEARDLYGRPHLPQGAPTSPALANLCTYRADCRLSSLAEAAGAHYTRYADDLAFSGGKEFERSVDRFSIEAASLLLEEGLAVNHGKSRVMKQGVRQHLAGLVINQRPNVRRDEFDQLKAILNNCVRSRPETQNRSNHRSFRLHLDGRIAFVAMVNEAKGQKLRALFDQIQWDE